MKKTIATTFALAAIAALLAAYLLLSRGGEEQKQKSEEWKPTLIFPGDARITRIELERGEEVLKFELDPQNGAWRITSPVSAWGEPVYMNMLVGDLKNLKKERLISLFPEDLSLYQLDPPRGVFHVTYEKDGEVFSKTLLLGKRNYTQDHLFAKLGDEPTVFLVKPEVELHLISKLTEIRAKMLMFHSPAEIVRIVVRIPDQELKARHPEALETKLVVQTRVEQEPQWVLVEPVHENAYFDKVKLFLNMLHRIGAVKIIDLEEGEDPGRGFDSPRMVITLTARDGAEEKILFGDSLVEDGEKLVYAKNRDADEIMVIRNDTFVRLLENNFRAPVLAPGVRVNRVSRVALEFPEDPSRNMTIEKKEPRLYHFWDQGREEFVTIGRLVWLVKPFKENAIRYLVHHEPLPVERYGLDRPRLRLKVFEDEQLVLDVSLGDTVSDQLEKMTFAKDNLRDCIVAVEGDLYEIMPLQKQYLKAAPEDLERIQGRRRRRK